MLDFLKRKEPVTANELASRLKSAIAGLAARLDSYLDSPSHDAVSGHIRGPIVDHAKEMMSAMALSIVKESFDKITSEEVLKHLPLNVRSPDSIRTYFNGLENIKHSPIVQRLHRDALTIYVMGKVLTENLGTYEPPRLNGSIRGFALRVTSEAHPIITAEVKKVRVVRQE